MKKIIILIIITSLLSYTKKTEANQEEEINTLVRSWFKGFDQHQKADYFFAKLDSNFEITLPDGKN